MIPYESPSDEGLFLLVDLVKQHTQLLFIYNGSFSSDDLISLLSRTLPMKLFFLALPSMLSVP